MHCILHLYIIVILLFAVNIFIKFLSEPIVSIIMIMNDELLKHVVFTSAHRPNKHKGVS